MRVINAEGAVLGRLASEVAKMLMKDEKVIIVNAEKAIITGKIDEIYAKYKQRIDRADISNPRKGPKFPRRPDMLVKRTIRGMIPKTSRGKRMLKALRVYMGVPKEYAGKAETLTIRKPRRGDYITLEKLSEMLGWKSHVKG